MKRWGAAFFAGLLLAAGLTACGPKDEAPVSSSSSSPPASSAFVPPVSSLTKEEAILVTVNGILDKYRIGEYPDYKLNTPDNLLARIYILDSFPSDSVLPEAVSWDDLTAEFGSGTHRDVVTLPLENDYEFVFEGNEPFQGEWLALDIRIQDLRDSRDFNRIETDYGTFRYFKADRISMETAVENLVLNGFPSENSSYLRLDRVRGLLVLHMLYPDGSAFSATNETNPPPISGTLPTGLTENDLYNHLADCRALLENTLVSQTLTDAESEQLVGLAAEVLQSYASGVYPLPLQEGTEYHCNDPFPAGVPVPPSVPDDWALSPEASGYSTHLLRLPLDNGYRMLLRLSLYPGSESTPKERQLQTSLIDVRFETPDGDVIPHP